MCFIYLYLFSRNVNWNDKFLNSSFYIAFEIFVIATLHNILFFHTLFGCQYPSFLELSVSH